MIAAFALAAAVPPADAQEQRGDTLVVAPPIRVDAVRVATSAGSGSALELKVRDAQLPAAPSLESVLRALPTVTVRTNSRGEAQFSLRGSGSDARQVAVLMDGVPLSIGWDHRTDLSVLPAGAVSSVTLLRGVPSLLHGPNVLGGVVLLGVADALTARHTDAEASLDHTGGWSAAARAGADTRLAQGVLTIRGGGGFRSRAGWPLPDGIDYGRELRTNTDLHQGDGFAALHFAATGGLTVSLTASGALAERGIAPELHTTAPRYWRYPGIRRGIAALGVASGERSSPLGGTLDVALNAGIDAADTEIESFESAAYASVIGRESAIDRTRSLRLTVNQSAGARSTLRIALTGVDVRRDEELDGVDLDYRQRIWSAAAAADTRLGTGVGAMPELRLNGSIALDGADTPLSGDKDAVSASTAWGARGGAALVSRDGVFELHAAASRRSRFPSLRELYSGALGRFEPNPALRPETLTAAELGVTARSGSLELQAVGFYRNLADAIEQIVLDSGRRQRVNIGNLESAGVELLAALHGTALDVSADLALQHVAERGVLATPRPDYQPAISGGAQLRLALPAQLSARAQSRFQGTQYCNADGGTEQRMAPSIRHDIGVNRSFTAARGRIEAAFDIENIAGATIYDQCGLPQPGRTFRIHLRVRT